MSTTTCKLSATMMEWICALYLRSACLPPSRAVSTGIINEKRELERGAKDVYGTWEGRRRAREITHLSLGGEEVNHLLHSSGAVHVERDIDQILSDGLADDIALLISGVFE